MKSTEGVLKIIKRELYFAWHSKKILILFLVLISLCGFHLFGLYNESLYAYDRYRRTERQYIELEIDIVEALSRPNIRTVEDGVTTITNPIRDDFVNLSISVQNMMPQNVASNFLEFAIFVFCAVLFGIYAGYVAVYDYKYKTFKVLSINYSQKDIIIGKIASIIVIMAVVIFVSLIVVFIGSFFVRDLAASRLPIDEFALDILNYEHSLIKQLLLSFAVLAFHTIIGFSIGFISKTMVAPTIAVLLFSFVVPILGAYDPRNIISYLTHEFFSFVSRFVMFTPADINVYLGIIVIFLITSTLLAASAFISKKRSRYN